MDSVRAFRLDCSNDELVEKAMADVLSQKIGRAGNIDLFVADEFHMLTREQKWELVTWIIPKLLTIKFVMIGNRSDGTRLEQVVLFLRSSKCA
jgi:hypothetical protein